jgi:hypothetical protein
VAGRYSARAVTSAPPDGLNLAMLPLSSPAAAELVQVVATDAHEGPVYVAGEDAL